MNGGPFLVLKISEGPRHTGDLLEVQKKKFLQIGDGGTSGKRLNQPSSR